MTARDRTIVLVLAAVALVAGFWFLGLKPKRAEIQAADAQIATQRERLHSAQTTLIQGRKAKAGYAADYATVAKLGTAVPADDDLPSLVFQLDSVSHGAKVDLRGLTRGSQSGASSSATSSASTPATAQSAASALPPGATVGTAGLATLPFNLDFSGSFFDLQRFLADVQGWVRSGNGSLAIRGRLLTIDGVSLQPGSKGLSDITAKVAATAYLSPKAAGNVAPASAGTSSSGTTPSDSGATAAATSSAITEGESR
jgi:Tfp pilus assembly protein PilO